MLGLYKPRNEDHIVAAVSYAEALLAEIERRETSEAKQGEPR